MSELLDRMELLTSLKDTLIEERKFYVNRKEWPAVAVRKQALRSLEERLCTVRFQIGMLKHSLSA